MSTTLDDFGDELVRCELCRLEAPVGGAVEDGWREIALSWAPNGIAWCCPLCWRWHP